MARPKRDPLPDTIALARDVLDKLMVDCDSRPLGRADSVVLVIEGDLQPRVARLEAGTPALARRIGRRPGRWISALGRRLGLHGGRSVRVSFHKIRSSGVELQIDTNGDHSPLLAWERWIGGHIIRYIPGRKRR